MHGSMQNVAPVINQAHRRGTLRLAFLSAVVSLVASFAAAAAPVPLYNIYRAEDGFTNFGISMAIVTYSVGTMAGLLVLGRLSNHLGRRLTAIASLGLLLLGCLLLLNVHDIGTLLAGRVLMGVGTGLASSTLTSYIVDAAPARPEWLASVASSQGPMLGLTVGAIASGALVQFGLWPRNLIYLICVGFLSVSAVLIAISPETATPTPRAWRTWADIFRPILLLSLSMSLAIAPLTTLVLTSVESDRAGTASGVNSAVSRARSLFAIALLGGVLQQGGRRLFSGFHMAMAVAAVACVLATLAVFIIEPGPHVDFIPRD
jgi:MFS family permease